MIKVFAQYAVVFALAAVFIAGCAEKAVQEHDAVFYKELGDDYMAKKKYRKSIEAYENALMRAESPDLAGEIQLSLANSYFLYKKYNDAIPIYETYIDVYAGLPSADIAYLRLGLSHYELIERPGRDQTDTNSALNYFGKVKERRPDMYKEFALEEKTKLLLERLAKKELIVGKYYARILKREPAILRYKYLIEKYPDSEYYTEAAFRLAKLLIKEGKADEAATYVTLLKMKRPDDKYARKAENLLKK